jgi:tRNA-Thr(GGU) m(6)t(6)A37 methyltransferase TsaA
MKAKMMSKDKVTELKEQITDLRKRWPAHSVPPAMMERLDALAEELAMELKKRSETETFRFRAIGFVENEFQKPTEPDTLRASRSRIVLAPELLEGLIGLKPGMALLVVFVFHRAEGYDQLQHPRGDRSRPKRGVFALRSPNRPNPIGITEVELLAIEENVLTVRGLDALDGTPVLDLKPV